MTLEQYYKLFDSRLLASYRSYDQKEMSPEDKMRALFPALVVISRHNHETGETKAFYIKELKAGGKLEDISYSQTIWCSLYEGIKRQLSGLLGDCECGYQIFTFKREYLDVSNGVVSSNQLGSLIFDAPMSIFCNQIERNDYQSIICNSRFLFPSSAFLTAGQRQHVLYWCVKQKNGGFRICSSLCPPRKYPGVIQDFSLNKCEKAVFFEDDAISLFSEYVEERDIDRLKDGISFLIHNALSAYCETHDCLPICGGMVFTPSSFIAIGSFSISVSSITFFVFNPVIDVDHVSSVLLSVTRSWGEIFHSLINMQEVVEKANLLRLSSTKSAIGAIMARNGSHNIGSHVLSALSHNVGTMPDDRVLYQYIQHRMDYIASATTGAPDWSVPTPFVGNAMKMFYSQRHLLDHIAESDGLHSYQYQGKGTQFGEAQKNCVKIVVRKIERYKRGGAPEERAMDNEWNRKWRGGECVDIYEFFQKDTVNWGLDEAVSIPGGILGQHAFYNIVENVLRNAAKHSWAGQDKKLREDAGNLEIYIDFENREDISLMKGWMSFTVGDNMSKLFPEEFWGDFFKAFPSTAAAFADPLDGFEVLPEQESKRAALSRYLEGKDDSTLPDSLPHYQKLQKYVRERWEVLRKNKDFLALLQGTDPNDPKTPNKELGHRLPLPLHHRQEIALAKPFIDLETNRLRQSAWGLSEMKISAGYLRRASVSVIGGLKSEVGNLPLIVPMGVPRREKDGDTTGCSGDNVRKNNELSYKDMCLAYRFWVKLPKDVLIVADEKAEHKGTDSSPFGVWAEKVKAWDGVDVQPYDKVLGAEGDIGMMSDYSFVLIDHAGDIAQVDLLKLPFHSLQITHSGGATSGLPQVPSDVLMGASQDGFVRQVYRAWLGYLKERRGKDKNAKLTVKLHIYKEEGGEKGLISDRDIYKVLFRECLHSILEPLAGDFTLPALQRKALLLVSLYPLNEDDDLFNGVEEKVGDNHLAKIKRLLGSIADRVRCFWMSLPCASEKDCGKWDQLKAAYQAGLERALASMRYKAIPKALLDELNAIAVQAGEGALLQELNAMAENPTESSIVNLAAGALDVARTTSDVFLRKYEERIVTLPRQYKGAATPKASLLEFGDFGVDIACGATAGPIQHADISYNRHDTDDAPLYSEPLSGSQTYLNALSNLSGDDTQWVMRLAENGLLRIAIIDERVRAFIAEHGEEIKRTYASMHIAVVDTSLPPTIKADEAVLPDLMKLPFIVDPGDDDFDLVVIHQGIIDKWWPGKHGKDEVRDILHSLRNPTGGGSRFVVVTTGRGRPDSIPDNEKVLAFSSVEAFLFKRYPEKLNLVNSLMNILPGSPERNEDDD